MTLFYSRSFWGGIFLCTLFPFLLSAQVQNVTASVKGGRYNAPFTATLTTPTPNAYIRYTLDGNEPDSLLSPQYGGAFFIDKTTTLRARAFAPGQVSSRILTHTYLFNVQHNFPIVAVSFKPNDFFSQANGIYPNFEANREVPVHLEMYENGNNTAVIDQYMGTEIQGSASAQLPQKSLEFKAKAVYGATAVPYKAFPDLPYTSYKRLVIRNSGQDWNITQFRDDYATSVHQDLSDLGGILKKPEIYCSSYRPVVAYYNGEYWGVYSLKERMKATFVEQHFNLKPTDYDMVENEMTTINGDSTVWLNFQNYLNSGVNFADNNNYNVLTSKIDMQNFIDVMAYNVFVDHEDWPANNNRRFLPKAAGSKWKWISFDYDFTFGLFQATGGFNTGDASPNALKRLLDPSFQFFNNYGWSTVLFRKCWESPQFRRDFSNRLADMMNTMFKPNRMNQRVSNFQNLYADELVKHANRWGNPIAPVLADNVNKIKSFNNNRAPFVYAQVDEFAPDVTGTTNIVLSVSPAGTGTLQFSTLSLGNANFPFNGTYFMGIDIPVVATPAAGYVFTGWSDASLPQVNSVNVRLSGPKNLIANFALANGNPCLTDVTPPVLTACPATITQQTSSTCATVNWVAPTATDNCSTPSVSSNFQSGTCFPIGTTNVVYTARDARGNQSTCSFNVVVQQNVVPPTDVCKTYTGVDVNNFCGCSQNQYNPYSIRIDPPVGSADCRGTMIIVGNGSVSFERKAGGTATFKGTFRTATWQLVTLDLTLSGGTSTPPAGAPVKAFCMANQPVTDWFYYTSMTGTYQEGGSAPLSIALNGTPFQVGTGASQQLTGDLGLSMRFRVNNDPNRVGWLNMKLTNETVVTCTTGGGGNPCDTDTQPPVFQNCPASRTLTTTAGCATTTWAAPTATDNCSTPVVFQLAGQQSGSCFPIGTQTVTYRANDIKGNIATCTFNITVQTGGTGGGGQDLSLAVTGSSASYSKFGVTTFTVAARNLGTAAFTNVLIKFPYPTGVNTGGNPVATLGNWQEWRLGLQVFEWQIPNFPANSTATLNVPLYFTSNVANSSNFTATLLSSTPTDANTANNQATLTLGLAGAAAAQGIVGRTKQRPTQLIPIVVYQISPNPTNGDVFMDIESIVEEEVTFEVANTLGQVVRTEKIAVKKGQTKVYLDANMLQGGVYFVTPQTKLARNVPTKFSKM
jgi:CotH kinase protein/HYR domain/Chitobiase/beta-hexosaminidase C-terminal domain/Domain of unknown function DUF11/Secretion system C-terminal sorting domain/Divergent InlB B-repeat domain